ncbi:MAG: hypothetical protein HC842_00575 [Cytophagales bacterium]|nr:hypothetical protein [Cytophagales bacterium]
MARQIVDERRKMGNYAPMPVLMNAMQLPWIDDEAMHYFISDEGHRGIAFLAVVTSNPLTVMALEGLIRLDKITYPCCHFAEEAEAIRWLKGLQATIPVNKNLQFLLQ